MSFAFPALGFKKTHKFYVAQGSVDALFRRGENIYNTRWLIAYIQDNKYKIFIRIDLVS